MISAHSIIFNDVGKMVDGRRRRVVNSYYTMTYIGVNRTKIVLGLGGGSGGVVKILKSL